MLGPVIGGAAASSVGFSGAMLGAGLLCLVYAAITFGSNAIVAVGRLLGIVEPLAPVDTSHEARKHLKDLTLVARAVRGFNNPNVPIDIPPELLHAEWVKVRGVVGMLTLFGNATHHVNANGNEVGAAEAGHKGGLRIARA